MVFTTTSSSGSASIVIATDVLEDESITLTDSFVVKGTFNVINYTILLFYIQNSGGTNDLDYELYGHADPNNGTAPTFSTNTWFQLKASTTIQENAVGVETLTNRYAYVVLRMKRTALGQDTTAKVWVRVHKS